MDTLAVVVAPPSGPGFLIRAVWFILIGWWLTAIVISVAYIAAVTVIGLPLAFYLFNRIPVVLTLRGRTQTWETTTVGDHTVLQQKTIAQHPLLLRLVYFVLVGWWLGFVWLVIAYFLAIIVVTLPVALLMFNRVGAIMTLLRY